MTVTVDQVKFRLPPADGDGVRAWGWQIVGPDGDVIGSVRGGHRHTYGREYHARAVTPDGRLVKGYSWDTRRDAVAMLLRNLEIVDVEDMR